jgi:hypothetical protein
MDIPVDMKPITETDFQKTTKTKVASDCQWATRSNMPHLHILNDNGTETCPDAKAMEGLA